MAVKLVRRKNPRGALRRWLSEDEERAVKNFYGLRKWGSTTDYHLRKVSSWKCVSVRPGWNATAYPGTRQPLIRLS